jgi:anti-sigma-K factor RskA
MKNSDSIDLNQERKLASEIQSLAVEGSPSEDLWPAIEKRIRVYESLPKLNKPESSGNSETKFYRAKWIPWAIAASLVVSLGSLSISWQQLEKAEVLLAELEQPNRSKTIEAAEAQVSYASLDASSPNEKGLQTQVNLMEQEFKLARVGLMSRIAMNRSKIDKSLLKDIQERLQEVESAADVLKQAIAEQPNNLVLAELLKTTYQQELNVLTQLAKLDNTI